MSNDNTLAKCLADELRAHLQDVNRLIRSLTLEGYEVELHSDMFTVIGVRTPVNVVRASVTKKEII